MPAEEPGSVGRLCVTSAFIGFQGAGIGALIGVSVSVFLHYMIIRQERQKP